jgi:arsenate reductase (thioredoxin)
MEMKNVLFLCTGNSCRSQMAEGLVNGFLAPEWQAYSAGTRPSGYVHPLAIRAMAELGIDLGGHYSKSPEALSDQSFDLVVTVCDSAAEECPIWLGEGRVVHISFPDPAEATGSDEEAFQVFRSVRDDIRRKVLGYLQEEFVPS